MAKESLEVRRRVQCARHGHPPVISMCFGYVSCGRCEAQIGDTLAGYYDTSEKCIIGHDCEVCRRIWDSLTPEQRKLTPDPFAKVEEAVNVA